MRADAKRNREKVIDAAMTAFEREGLGVSVAEIGRRAGVGTGTVSRHFPTKESLFEAIVLVRIEEILGEADRLLSDAPPGEAFFRYFAYMVWQASKNKGLAEALTGGGFDVEAAAERTGHGLDSIENRLLTEAQRAGAVRPDVTRADVKTLLNACVTAPDPARMIQIVTAGLQP